MSKENEKELTLDEARRQLHGAQAAMDHLLEKQGDLLAKEHGWTHVNGLDAIRYYLMQKHHWTPAELFVMSMEHLRFAMLEEQVPSHGKKGGA